MRIIIAYSVVYYWPIKTGSHAGFIGAPHAGYPMQGDGPPNRVYNMGVAYGPGYPLQVLALPVRNPYTRCGLYTAIPNAACARGREQ
ncbi:hypothetical protein ABIC45_002812 [Mucilaginibacter rubeus]|uniref:hypothetical protein n=1 Tax=Mucilaginibacter rubeus TaxID=2027860 RepID=UPI00339AEA6E